jgi:hypothetical protein
MFARPPWGRLRVKNPPFQFIFSRFITKDDHQPVDNRAKLLQENGFELLLENNATFLLEGQ